MRIAKIRLDSLNREGATMLSIREPWIKVWQDISNYFLPRRYVWLKGQKDTKSAREIRNTVMLDGTTVRALRTLATGMMNGITSPIRTNFSLRVFGLDGRESSYEETVWLEKSADIMHLIMAESNFYNALGILYTEWCAFGTASMAIYEDEEDVVRCYNYALGEFCIASDHTRRVRKHFREFELTAAQMRGMFPDAEFSDDVKNKLERGADALHQYSTIRHMILPAEELPELDRGAPFLELYWEATCTDGRILRVSPLEEFPNLCPRWETYGSDDYGTSECMTAIPDVMQLQQMVKRRGQALDLAVRPPMIYNASMMHSEKQTTPGGSTYANTPELVNAARPLFQIQVPFDQLQSDIMLLQRAIQEQLFNDLFLMISQLQTVRSATEVDARREERLVMLGPVLKRFEEEGIGPAINRIFQICLRRGLFPPMPESLRDKEISIQYVGVLSDAQRAIGTIPIERYLQVLGNMIQIYPDEVSDVPNAEEIFRGYGRDIGLPEKYQRSREEVAARRAQKEQEKAQAQMAAQGESLAKGAQSLSATDLGGGVNALQAVLGAPV